MTGMSTGHLASCHGDGSLAGTERGSSSSSPYFDPGATGRRPGDDELTGRVKGHVLAGTRDHAQQRHIASGPP